MSDGFLIQLAGSAVAISVLVLIAGRARIARPVPPLNETTLQGYLAFEFPDLRPDSVWFTPAADGAVAQAGDLALVVFRLGDGYVSRSLAWSALASGRRDKDAIVLSLPDPAAAKIRLAWPSASAWPPAPQNGPIA